MSSILQVIKKFKKALPLDLTFKVLTETVWHPGGTYTNETIQVLQGERLVETVGTKLARNNPELAILDIKRALQGVPGAGVKE